MSEKSDYYNNTYGMSFGTYCMLASGKQPSCVVDTRNNISNGTELDWVWTTPAKSIVGSKAVSKIVKECGL